MVSTRGGASYDNVMEMTSDMAKASFKELVGWNLPLNQIRVWYETQDFGRFKDLDLCMRTENMRENHGLSTLWDMKYSKGNGSSDTRPPY